MSEQAMSEALDFIHDEALKLLGKEMSKDVQRGLELIMSIARYKHVVTLTDFEKAHADEPAA